MKPKLIIWKCADECCLRHPIWDTVRWHAGTVKHKPFLSTITHARAIDYYRTEWAS